MLLGHSFQLSYGHFTGLCSFGDNMTLNMRQKLAIRIAVNEQFGESTANEQLLEEICQLRFQIAELQKANSDLGWQLYPESMGR
jgi:hypothetical protein